MRRRAPRPETGVGLTLAHRSEIYRDRRAALASPRQIPLPLAAPQENVATFLRRLGGTAWERLPVALPYPYKEEVQLLDPLVPAPGGGTRLFLLVPGLGLVRADLPEPP